MTGRPPAPGRPRDTFGLRLTLSFLGVALAAVALLAGLTAVFASSDVSALVYRQRTNLTAAVADAAAAGWERRDTWAGADLSPALALAARTGADAQIRDQSGTVVASSAGFHHERGRPAFSARVMIHGRDLGRVTVRFSGTGFGAADDALKSDLVRAILIATGLATLLALLTGLAIARRLTHPVRRIISVARAMGAGMRTARVGQIRAPDELRELGTAFDHMADMLDRQEQLRRDLVADVAHELRTPIAILQAGHEALLDGLTEPTPQQLGSLRDEVLRLARMVDDLQTLAAADAAALHPELRECDLADIAASGADSLSSRFSDAGLTLERRLSPAAVYADPRWMHQVVTNLLTNALKFSPAGSTVAIEVRRQGHEALLGVTDQGIGIPAAELPHIFDRFWRGKQAGQTSGSGIGLAVAGEVIRAHGGNIIATSEPGAGTELRVSLPAVGSPIILVLKSQLMGRAAGLHIFSTSSP
jgi:two-component system, OmpR family, sensor histidine kinase BaeS